MDSEDPPFPSLFASKSWWYYSWRHAFLGNSKFYKLLILWLKIGSFRLNYRPQRSWAKVMFLQASVILSTGGVCLSAWWDARPPPPGTRHPPGSRHPPGPDPPDQTPPRPGTPRSRPPTRAPPPGKQTPAYSQCAAGTHPTGMHSCLIIISTLNVWNWQNQYNMQRM